jgi:phage anti-repressor protein
MTSSSKISLPKLTVDEVLKIFTTVPKKFIDDFFKFTQLNKDVTSDFFIDVNKLSIWLDVSKYTITQMLKRSYVEGVDYIKRVDTKKTSINAHHKKEILLTSECMKRICMSSRSEKAETVRSYFIELEEFIIHYNDQIVDGLMRDIQDLAMKDRRNKKEDGPGLVYILRAASNVNKLGETMMDLIKRLSTYNTGRMKDVELLYSYRTTHRREVEKCVKALMREKRYRKRRELYEVDWEIISKLIKGCARLSLKLDQKNKSKLDGKYYIIFSSDIDNRESEI